MCALVRVYGVVLYVCFGLLFNVVCLLKRECFFVIYFVMLYGVCLCPLRDCMCESSKRVCVICLRLVV